LIELFELFVVVIVVVGDDVVAGIIGGEGV
jgi:hypothetical protein